MLYLHSTIFATIVSDFVYNLYLMQLEDVFVYDFDYYSKVDRVAVVVGEN